MNRVLYYHNFPTQQSGTVTPNLIEQEFASDIEISNNHDKYNYASFEGGFFEFGRKIYRHEQELENSLPYCSAALSNSRGQFANEPFIEIVPDEPYSGAGISIGTYYSDYEITVTILDRDGERQRTKKFKKRNFTSEFYPFPFDGLQSIVIYFDKIEPFHFLKIDNVSFGASRTIKSADFISYPTESRHFSLNNENLELNTLSFSIFGDRESYNFLAGEQIVSDSGFEYYVENANYNEDGTIDVECYDILSLLDDEYIGIMRLGSTQTNNPDVFESFFARSTGARQSFSNMLLGDTQTFSGTLPLGDTKREALNKFILGNALSLRLDQTEFGTLYARLFCPMLREEELRIQDELQPEFEFTEADIASVPEVEIADKKSRVHFSRHKYNVDKSSGKQEAFNDYVETGSDQRLEFSSPYVRVEGGSTVREYYHNGTPFTAAELGNFVVQAGAYFSIVNNPSKYSGQEIVVKDYPFKVSYTSIDYKNEVSSQYRQNDVMISNCSICATLSTTADTNKFRQYLGYIYDFRVTLKFNSLQKAKEGTFGTVSFGGNTFEGWIVKAQDNFNDSYSYEVVCR